MKVYICRNILTAIEFKVKHPIVSILFWSQLHWWPLRIVKSSVTGTFVTNSIICLLSTPLLFASELLFYGHFYTVKLYLHLIYTVVVHVSLTRNFLEILKRSLQIIFKNFFSVLLAFSYMAASNPQLIGFPSLYRFPSYILLKICWIKIEAITPNKFCVDGPVVTSITLH